MMSKLEPEYFCWKCGAPLKGVPFPLTRHSVCLVCQAELHVCRMCRHYAPRYTNACSHDHADNIPEKERANFCSYFRPRKGEQAQDDAEVARSKNALQSLFGEDTRESEDDSRAERAQKRTEASRRSLDELFGGENSDEPD